MDSDGTSRGFEFESSRLKKPRSKNRAKIKKKRKNYVFFCTRFRFLAYIYLPNYNDRYTAETFTQYYNTEDTCFIQVPSDLENV